MKKAVHGRGLMTLNLTIIVNERTRQEDRSIHSIFCLLSGTFLDLPWALPGIRSGLFDPFEVKGIIGIHLVNGARRGLGPLMCA